MTHHTVLGRRTGSAPDCSSLRTTLCGLPLVVMQKYISADVLGIKTVPMGGLIIVCIELINVMYGVVVFFIVKDRYNCVFEKE